MNLVDQYRKPRRYASSGTVLPNVPKVLVRSQPNLLDSDLESETVVYEERRTMRRLDGRNTVEGPKFFNQQCSAGHRREIWKDEDSVEVEDSGTGHVYKSESQTNSYKKVINQNADNGVAIEITYKGSSVMHIEQLPQSERFSTKAYNGPAYPPPPQKKHTCSRTRWVALSGHQQNTRIRLHQLSATLAAASFQ
ncbi:hypothetical protein T265_01979 [Opisthorchis viverrini]|uniref:Uncharacterized protein n=1 Tax=Opisthorchis viverrini TaxID=6198 RepID=A0A075A857_OPIVI|nr:hypothetical protein T265_01979 [Opisthorchis viverrini]KER31895.1 hypothetical protein T265_01979 [Opisthorchis viverrini]